MAGRLSAVVLVSTLIFSFLTCGKSFMYSTCISQSPQSGVSRLVCSGEYGVERREFLTRAGVFLGIVGANKPANAQQIGWGDASKA